jgi:hypothetical protein
MGKGKIVPQGFTGCGKTLFHEGHGFSPYINAAKSSGL